jgi:hypothetical protein
MKLDELREILKDKTTLQVRAISQSLIGKEIVIETKIFDIDEYIFIRDSNDKFILIKWNQDVFYKQLLEYSVGTNVILTTLLERVTGSFDLNFGLSLISISRG